MHTPWPWEKTKKAKASRKAEKQAHSILIKNRLTTHELAKALLVLPEKTIEHEDHTDIWSDEFELDGGTIQVGLHRF